MTCTTWARVAIASFVLLLGTGAASAQNTTANWPNKPVRIIVNFAPGGSTDNAMRPFAERLSKAVGQQFVIDNKGGASGAIGIEAAIKSPADGYTFIATPVLSVAILPHVRKVAFDVFKDLMPVSNFTNATLLIAVHPSVPANSLQELVAHAKANPGKLSWGTAGIGSQGHMICEALKIIAGIDILHVPYRGGSESLADFLAGVHQIHVDPNTFPHVAAGKGKLLAVLDSKRHPTYPNVPLLSEVYPELDYLGWFALYAAAGTPQAIVNKMSAEMAKVAAQADLREHFLKLALSPNPGTPAELAALTRKDFDRYGALVKKLDLRME